MTGRIRITNNLENFVVFQSVQLDQICRVISPLKIECQLDHDSTGKTERRHSENAEQMKTHNDAHIQYD